MGTWITEDELKNQFGDARIDDLSDRDRDGSPEADVLSAAIASGEGRAKSILLQRFSESQLPDTPTAASSVLKDAVAKLAFYFLHDHMRSVSDDVIRHRDDGLALLRDIRSGSVSLLLAGAPSVDRARAIVATRRRSSDLTDQPITLSKMEEWGR